MKRHQPVVGVVAQQHTSLAEPIPIPMTSSSSDPSMERRNLHLSCNEVDRVRAQATEIYHQAQTDVDSAHKEILY